MLSRVAVFALWILIPASALRAMQSVPKSEYRSRREALASKLQGGVAIVFAGEEPLLDFLPFRQDADFFYLTGWLEPGAAMVVIAPGPQTRVARVGTVVPAHDYREILFLPERDPVLEKYTGVKMDAAATGVKAATGFDEVMPMSALPGVLATFVGADRRVRGREVWAQANVPAAKATIGFLAASLGVDEIAYPRDVRGLTTELRIVKSPAEIALLRKAADVSIAAQLAGMRAIRPGVLERSVAGTEIATMMTEGCEGVSYAPIVGSGINSTTLHYSENGRVMQGGDVVTIDEAAQCNMYASDITRSMPVDGHFTSRQREIYDVVLGAQRAAVKAFVAGKSRMGTMNERETPSVTDSLDKVAFDYINTHGEDLHGAPLGKYFLHSLGHSVGIDVHDPMDYERTKLDRGMVFTIEPGIYIPEEKLGIRIEDVVYVDDNGVLRDLMVKLPHEATAIEEAMHQGGLH